MKHTSKNLWKLPVLVCLLGMAACEERVDVVPVDADTKPVEVSLCFGFADEEDRYNLSASADTRGVIPGRTVRSLPAGACRADPCNGTGSSGCAVPVLFDAIYG